MSGHTPGPWVWRHKSGSLHQVGTDRPYGATVLTPNYEYDTGISIEASDADFALIAAAPDLLKFLVAWIESTDLREQTGSMRPVYLGARAAIAKATGDRS